MKIALAQINPVIGDFAGNAAKIQDVAAKAQGLGADVVVFSEMVLSGYPPRDLLEKPSFVDAGTRCLDGLIERIRGIGVICGAVAINPEPHGKALFNVAVLFEDGRVLHRVEKRLLPAYDVFDESRHFEPGRFKGIAAYKGRRIGLTICEDAWNDKDVFSRPIYHCDPVADMMGDGADLIVNISASVYHSGKQAFRARMLGAIGRKYGVPLVYVNQVGGSDSILFDGASLALDRSGGIAARAADFAEDLVVFDDGTGTGDLHPVAADAPASIYKALVLGTRDYVTKCGFHNVVLGLSGGIDSALVACIAVDALGKDNVKTLFMPSAYTSLDNYQDTAQLAANLGIAREVVPIDPIFEAFARQICPGYDPAHPGITEQNIQARIRGTLLMAVSNREGSLVLSTGNKSEMAVGYCTLYGDMNGGLAVISDVAKTMVYRLARLVNARGEVIPPRIIAKAPSAELKPGQTDQDDLPPYDVIDPILKGVVEDLQSPDQLVLQGFDPAVVADVVSRVERSEYKRRQAAPGLKITPKAFGEGRRYPLAMRFRPWP
jgi:NAD+ synthetase